MNAVGSCLKEEAYSLAKQLFKDDQRARVFAIQLFDVCVKARGKDFLIVHNPGGWGNAHLEQCLEWERSIVYGIKSVIEEMGYSFLLTQYLRSGKGWLEQIRDLREQFRFFASKAKIMTAWLRFIFTYVSNINTILIGVSQGAAFGSAVMRQLGELYPVYSIEIGFPFQYKSWRKTTERTVAIDSNGLRPDVLVQGNLVVGARILLAAPFKWLWYHLRGTPLPLALCINAPGHEYSWDNPMIQRRIRDFLEVNFGCKR